MSPLTHGLNYRSACDCSHATLHTQPRTSLAAAAARNKET